MDVNTLIGLGILGFVGYLGRQQWLLRDGQNALRTDIKELKTVLGINGHPDMGLVPRVQALGERSHQHANDITVLMAERDLRIREAK